jgi:hypothetical protein
LLLLLPLPWMFGSKPAVVVGLLVEATAAVLLCLALFTTCCRRALFFNPAALTLVVVAVEADKLVLLQLPRMCLTDTGDADLGPKELMSSWSSLKFPVDKEDREGLFVTLGTFGEPTKLLLRGLVGEEKRLLLLLLQLLSLPSPWELSELAGFDSTTAFSKDSKRCLSSLSHR